MAGKITEEPRELWEQQPDESETAFLHFAMYRDMRYPKIAQSVYENGKKTDRTTQVEVTDGTIPYEKRSLRKLAATLGVNFRTISRQSENGNWVKRCEAYDAYVDRRNREANEAAIRKMHTEHALIAQQILRKATNRILTIPAEQISAAELVRMVDVGVKVERLSRGESTENQAIIHDGEVEIKAGPGNMDLSGLSDEELDQFERLLEKINGDSDS